MAAKKKLPRLVPGGPSKPRARREVDLPGIGASVVIEAPSVGAYLELEQSGLKGNDYDIALIGMALVEPEMTAEEFKRVIEDWPITDWQELDRALSDLMGISEEALRAAQREFRESDD